MHKIREGSYGMKTPQIKGLRDQEDPPMHHTPLAEDLSVCLLRVPL